MDPNSPWGVLPTPAVWDRDIDDIYRAVGEALSEWERLEFACLELYIALLASKNLGAGQGYGSVVAFSGRIELLKTAFAAFPYTDQPGFADEFVGLGALLTEIDRLSARRNEIAHGVASDVTIGGRRGFLLLHAGYATNKQSLDNHSLGKYAYGSGEILIYARRFAERESLVQKYSRATSTAWRTPL